jgi:glycosyltransferase involved in cell wall biosynthesis
VKPRLGIFTRPIDQGTSGSGAHLLEIVRALTAINRDFELTLIHYERNDREIYARARELIVPRSPVGAARALARERFDVVHYSPLTIYAPLWGVGARKVATIHGVEQLLLPRFYPAATYVHELLVVPLYARAMDAIVTVSETTRAFIARRYRIPTQRITVCPNAVSAAYRVIPPREVSAPARFGISGPYVIHVSRFSERKNPWTMLRAFAAFAAAPEGRDHSLVLLGKGWDSPRVRALAGSDAARRLVAPGYVSERDKVELLNAASLFLYPSFAEGFGMPNLEAMACGCPVVTSRAFAIPEIVGDAALMIDDPQDHAGLAALMSRVIREPALRASLVERGLGRAAAFSWEESARRLLDVYRRLL